MLTPSSPFRSAAAPPALNAFAKDPASLSDILRSIVMVNGALADLPSAVLTTAVAVKTSAADCPYVDAGIITKAPSSAVAPSILFITVNTPLGTRLLGASNTSNPRSVGRRPASGLHWHNAR